MEDPVIQDIENQRAGFRGGYTPFMGRWQQDFSFPPVPYSAGAAARSNFVRKLRDQLKNKFLFSRFISVTLNLQLDTQTVMESDAYGDLDNYAKCINDALKGKDGIFIDDCQISRLNIGFELTGHTSFDVEINAMADDEYVLKEGLKLYGMPDGLFYPQATAVWHEGKVDVLDDLNAYAGLLIWETMVRTKGKVRHHGRQSGLTRLQAYHSSKPAMPLQLGFHRSRAIVSGLEIVEFKEWRRCADELARNEGRLETVIASLRDYASGLTFSLLGRKD